MKEKIAHENGPRIQVNVCPFRHYQRYGMALDSASVVELYCYCSILTDFIRR